MLRGTPLAVATHSLCANVKEKGSTFTLGLTNVVSYTYKCRPISNCLS